MGISNPVGEIEMVAQGIAGARRSEVGPGRWGGSDGSGWVRGVRDRGVVGLDMCVRVCPLCNRRRVEGFGRD